MTISESDYIDVLDQASRLGCPVPTCICLLPRNFDTAKEASELVHENTVLTMRKLLRTCQIPESRIEPTSDELQQIDERDWDWIAPIIYVPNQIANQNPFWVGAFLNAISTYVGTLFPRPQASKQTAKLSIIIGPTDSNKYKRFDYEGPVDGVESYTELVEKLFPKGIK